MKCRNLTVVLACVLLALATIIVVINVIPRCNEKQQQQQQQQQQQKYAVDSPLTVERGCRKDTKVCDGNSKAHSSIFYIKIHKTGSTALRSTLLRYGRRYNLTICMDATDLWGLNWPDEVDNERLTKPHNEKCEIVAEELVYNKEKVKQIMKDDVFVMSSVRHPVQHFLSLYKYTRAHSIVEKLHGGKVSQHDGMRMMLRNPNLIQNAIATLKDEEMRDKLQINLLRSNLQLFSLGITTYDFSTILERTNEIDFFVVAERYDESMIALRDKLCCNIEDVLYRKQNVRRTSSERKDVMPDDIRDAILEFNKGDLILYLIAIRRLECQATNETYTKQALEILKFELEKYEKMCMDLPVGQRDKICPPITNGQVGLFVEGFRTEQKKKLLGKLIETFKSRESSRKDREKN